MAFFRKWKTHYKHKKFSSEDGVDGEEDWGLERSQSSPKEGQGLKFDFDGAEAVQEKRKRMILGIKTGLKTANGSSKNAADVVVATPVAVAAGGALTVNADDGEQLDQPLFATYDLKYLGCTPIEQKRTEKITAEAIKTVIANSRAGGRKAKSLLRVKLNISKDGVEVLDLQSQDTLMRFSIYKISYCSVDAAHDHAFSFVASETDPLTEAERMSCHVFQCPKRKIAHEITLMVARCFETAYQAWRDAVVMEQQQHQQAVEQNAAPQSSSPPPPPPQRWENVKGHGLPQSNGTVNASDNRAMPSPSLSPSPGASSSAASIAKKEDSLIDLVTAEASAESMRKYLQNTWVSFDDECGGGVRVAAC